jgi:hypothetical protein
VNAFITATLAAARANLHRASVAQENALIFALEVYRPGARGIDARKQRDFWDRKRAAFLREALRERANWKALRRLARESERIGLADTKPPESETRRTGS